MAVIDLVPDVRTGLGVSSSYDDEKIPLLIRRTINRLLRDYHFPKSVKFYQSPALVEGNVGMVLPAGFKKELEFRFFNDADDSYTEPPMVKASGFRLPYPSGAPYYYWLEGLNLRWDTPLPASYAGFFGMLWYESMDVASNEDWVTDDFPDAVKYFATVRGAAEFRKPEVAQVFGPLWLDERESLAIYTNELEWDNMRIHMREPVGRPPERYPA